MTVHSAFPLAEGFHNGFNTLISAFPPGLLTFLALAGAAIALFGLFKGLKPVVKGGRFDGKAAAGPAIVGGVLVSPKTLIPLLLIILDWLVQLVTKILQSGTGGH